MKLQDILTEIQRLFAASDPAHGGTVVVWHDPNGEFAETVAELELDGVTVLCEREGERFELKRRLNEDLSGQRILLYRPQPRRLNGDWLADIEMRSLQFSADYASVQLRELGAPDTPEMRRALADRKAFLSKKTHLRELTKRSGAYTTPHQLDLGIMASCLKAASLERADVLRAWVHHLWTCQEDAPAGDELAAAALAPLHAAGVADSLHEAIAAWTGYTGDICCADALVQHILLTAQSLTLPLASLPVLANHYSAPHAAACRNVFDEWHKADASELLRLCRDAESALNLPDVLATLGGAALADADVFPCIDAIVLHDLFARVSASSSSVDDVFATVAARRACVWHEHTSVYYDGVLCAARMQQFYLDHGEAFAGMGATKLWDGYTQSFHLMDRWYRQLHAAFNRSLLHRAYDLDEDFRACCTQLEQLYKGWYLRELSRRWIGVCEQPLAQQGYVPGIARQVDFHMAEVEATARSKKRAWAIVSDALRYEVAAELSERLERETNGTCDLGSMQATFPSITKCGMPSLLPAGSFAMEEGAAGGKPALRVLVDGEEAPSTEARQKALRRHHPAAVAVQYDRFFTESSRAERRELVGDAEVVYIYHNAIDATGDKAVSEKKVFRACDEAIEQLCALVSLLVREFKAASVVVTADHGFLYTEEPLKEAEHASASDICGDVVELGRRYAVARAGATGGPLVQVKLPASLRDGADALVGFTPRECVRIARAGGGENYVHGGISLQEYCVPVLRFANKRRGAKGFEETSYASISLVSTLDCITNGLTTLEFLQSEPVSGKVLAASYEVFVGDDAQTAVTNPVRVVADRADENASARTSRVMLSLKAGAQTDEHAQYHLFARNEATGETAILRDLRISVAFQDDFGW